LDGDDNMSFNEQLTKLRKRNNITQIELANLMNVKQYVISSWETGRSEPNISQIIKLSDIFKISTDYLLDRHIIITNSENEFNKVIENINKDIKDDFTKDLIKIFEDIPNNKREKIINIVKEIKEL
jgi:transcriptional regulator with XRE-family HTH domain